MNVQEWLSGSTSKLDQAGIGTARLDALVLLEDVLNTNRTQLLAHSEQMLSSSTVRLLAEQLERRAAHEPLAYIRGKSEFYGREFVVSQAVLEPRPESETLIELLLNQPDLPHPLVVADIGTGSGALGITAFLELPRATVDLLDIDNNALEIAKLNVIKFATGQFVIQSDLLLQATRQYDVLLCNLPYVPDDYIINRAAAHEPALALFGGPDGLDIYRKLFDQVRQQKSKPLLILCESFPMQHEEMIRIATSIGYHLAKADDFIQVFRAT